MGNRTNPTKAASLRRLVQIERLAFWRGWVRRGDLERAFNISAPQASADIAAYLGINPGALRYDLAAKRYAAAPAMKPKLTKPALADGIELLSESDAVGFVARIDLPVRHVPLATMRVLVATVLSGSSVEIHYYSVNSGTAVWRWITPRAFGHDGYRWHARAWCHGDKRDKDFVLGRIDGTREIKRAAPIPPDRDWDTWRNVSFKANSSLSKIQRTAVEKDFGMVRGSCSLRVRRAMLNYTLSYLGLTTQPRPRLLQLA